MVTAVVTATAAVGSGAVTAAGISATVSPRSGRRADLCSICYVFVDGCRCQNELRHADRRCSSPVQPNARACADVAVVGLDVWPDVFGGMH